MSCDHVAHEEGEPCLIICSPSSVTLRRVMECPNCKCDRRFVGWAAVWYDTIWTCCHCGDSYSCEGRMQRPFARGWRQESIAKARRDWDSAPSSADGRRILREIVQEYVADSRPLPERPGSRMSITDYATCRHCGQLIFTYDECDWYHDDTQEFACDETYATIAAPEEVS